TLIATQAMNLAFVGPLKHTGLALAIGLGACINAALLYRALRRDGAFAPLPGWLLFLARVAFATTVMCAALAWTMPASGWWLAADWQARVGTLSALVLGGMAVYAVALLAAGLRPAAFLRERTDPETP
ncbi:MAG TPA: lipid II flippase MurJ, partial [Burkholderiales bacterium]